MLLCISHPLGCRYYIGDWDAEAEQVAVVVGIPDPIKGESLVLLTSRPVELVELRGKRLEVGLPNLWMPLFAKLGQPMATSEGRHRTASASGGIESLLRPSLWHPKTDTKFLRKELQ